jgi:hypothetical protein
MRSHKTIHQDIVTQGILCRDTTGTATTGRRDKVLNNWIEGTQSRASYCAKRQQVQELATPQIGHV